MKKSMLIFVIVLLALLAGWLFFRFKGPVKSDYHHLLSPVISEKADQNMLVVETQGEPGAAAAQAMKLLYTTYFKLKGVPKSLKFAAPRSRWLFSEDASSEDWKGVFGIPVPDSITTLPAIENPDNLKMYIAKWKYGTVAEILHIGPYDREDPTVQRLTDFIADEDYTIIGEHEEEYIKGPGILGKGNVEKYLTIIRYRVEKTVSE